MPTTDEVVLHSSPEELPREFLEIVGDARPTCRLTISEVHDLAVRLHRQKNQRYGMTKDHDGGMDGWHEYRHHLTAVLLILRLAGITDECFLAAALMHDVFEDTDFTVRDAIIAGVPIYAVAMAWACTDAAKGTRAEKKAEAYRKINLVYGAVIVKVADRIHNAGHSLESGSVGKFEFYKLEQTSFAEALEATFHAQSQTNLWHHLEWLLFSSEGHHLVYKRSECCENALVPSITELVALLTRQLAALPARVCNVALRSRRQRQQW